MFGLVIFALISALGLAWGFSLNSRLFQLPCMIGIANLVYICPQAGVLWMQRSHEFQQHLDSFLIFSSVCVIAAYAGFFSSNKTVKDLRHFNRKKLEFSGVIVGILGLAGLLALQILALNNDNSLNERRWTGLPVYFYTLSKLVCPGLTLILLSEKLNNEKASHLARAIKTLCFATISYYAFLVGRRQWTFLLAYSTLMPLILQRRIQLGRKTIILGILATPFIFLLLPAYRQHLIERDSEGLVQAITTTPPNVVVSKFLSGKQTIELEGAVMLVAATEKSGNYSWGGDIVNGFVNKYVPGGLIGRDFKSSLYFDTPVLEEELSYIFGRNYFVPDYTGKPSYYDAYTNFGWLGVLLYFFLGRIFGYYSHLAFALRDGSGILFMALLGFIPAGLVYGAWGFIIPIFMPPIAFFLLLRHTTMTVRQTEANHIDI